MQPEIYPIELIGSDSLAATAKPRSGDWIKEAFKNIRDEGIDVIVSRPEDHQYIVPLNC